jgi:hypothetical protein
MTHFVVTASQPASAGGAGSTATSLRIESIDFDSRGHDEWFVKEGVVTEKVERLFDGAGVASGGEESPVLGGTKSKPGAKKNGVTATGAMTRRKSAGKDDETGATTADVDPTRGLTLPRSAPLPTERVAGINALEYERHHLPKSGVGNFGITEMGMRCLEVGSRFAALARGGS